jgi:hypothetical protein
MISNRTFAISGVVLALILAIAVSPFASTEKDGLEKVAEQQGITAADKPVWTASPMPDYAMPGIADDGWAGAMAGLAGTAVVLGLGLLLRRLLVRRSP